MRAEIREKKNEKEVQPLVAELLDITAEMRRAMEEESENKEHLFLSRKQDIIKALLPHVMDLLEEFDKMYIRDLPEYAYDDLERRVYNEVKASV